jgi:amidohydrolase
VISFILQINKFLEMVNKEILYLRKELHKYPELSGAEYKTSRLIREFIKNHHPTQIIENIGGNGLAAIYDYQGNGPVITIRCELDGLPIEEENSFGHRSTINGISHKCGHDGHMAIVAGLIFWLKKQPFDSGKIILLFQPAEETGQGAFQIINDKKFKALKTDYVFALHNIPNEPLHSIIITKDGFSAEVQSFILKVKGKESHASEPENGINPALAISDIIAALAKLNITNPEDENFTILTPVHIIMGQKSYGISPAIGEIHYTTRTWSTEKMLSLKSDIDTLFKKICQSHELEYEVESLEYFPASENDPESNNHVYRAAQANQFKIKERLYPFKFGEDFGWYTKKYKTAMFGLGAGMDTPALHHSDYDFPDEIIETGITMFKAIILDIMKMYK